jgi:exonuclease SbcD
VRFLHTSDWHLGRRLYEASLAADQAHVLDQIFTMCRDERVDALIIAGDVFDRAVPPVDAVTLLGDFFERVARDLAIPIVAISGNHDSPFRLGFGAGVLARGRVHLLTSFDRRAAPVVVERGRRKLHIYGLPFLEPEVARAGLGDESLTTHQAAVAAALETVARDRAARGAAEAVLVGHLMASGGRESPESERPLVVGGAAQVGVDVLARDRWSYVALGHLHAAQLVGDRPDIRYSGSPLATTFGEAGAPKSASLVEIVCGRAAVRDLALVPLRPLARIRGRFEELLAAPAFAAAESAYVHATYTDGFVLDATARLRRRYPHLLQALPAQLEAAAPARIGGARGSVRSLDESELLQGFWEHVEGEVAAADIAEEFARVVARVRAKAREACALAS